MRIDVQQGDQSAAVMVAPAWASAEVLAVWPSTTVTAPEAMRTRRCLCRDVRVRWDIVARLIVGLAAVAATGLAVWAVVALVMAAVSLAVAAVTAVVAAVVAWVHAHLALLLGIPATAVALSALCSSGSGRCAGMHCGGCRR